MKKFYFLLMALCLFTIVNAQNIDAFSIDGKFNQVNYPLNHFFINSEVLKSVVLPDQKILILTSKKLLKLHQNGLIDTAFNTGSGIDDNQTLNNFEVQQDGKILLIGQFTSFNGVPNIVNRSLIRLNADGSRDTSFTIQVNIYNTDTSKFVTQPDGKVILICYLGFENFMVRLLNNGASDTTFTPATGYEFSNLVTLPDGKFLVSYRDSINLTTKIRRLNANGTIDTTFNILTLKGGDNNVSCLFLHESKVYVGGSFEPNNTAPNPCLVRYNLDGTFDSTFNVDSNFRWNSSRGSVHDIVVDGENKLLVSGSFNRFSNDVVNNIVRLNLDGTRDVNFNFPAGGNHSGGTLPEITKINLFSDGKIFVSGSDFLDIVSPNMALLNQDGTRNDIFQHYLRGTNQISISKVAEDGSSNLYVIGGFYLYNNLPKVGVMKIDENGLADNSFNFDSDTNGSSFSGGEYDKEINKLYIFFNNVLKRVNNNGSIDNSFAIEGTGFNGRAIKLIMPSTSGSVIVAGDFNDYNGFTCSGLIRLNSKGYKVQDYGMSFVNAIEKQSDGGIIVAGVNDFSGFSEIRRYLSNNTIDRSFNLDLQVAITSVLKVKALSDGKILVQGKLKVNGISKFLIRLNANGSYDSTFNAVFPESNLADTNFTIQSFDVLPNQKIILTYLYGFFPNYRWGMIRLLSSGEYDNTIQGKFSKSNEFLKLQALSNGKILVLGTAKEIYGNNSIPNGLFQLTGEDYNYINGNVKYDFDNNGCTSTDINYPFLKLNINSSEAYFTNQSGNYKMLLKEGNFGIATTPENPSYFNFSPSRVPLNLTSLSNVVNQDFCTTANGSHSDIEILVLPLNIARSGFDAKYKVVCKNKGNKVESGHVNLTFDDQKMDYVSSNPVFNSQSTNQLTWNFTNLQPFETRTINIVFSINSPMEVPAVNVGDVLSYTATIASANTDEVPTDNTFRLNQTVANSFDPNDKTCLEGNTVTPDLIGQYVHYMIRFENTGTFAAENIVVKDLIDLSKFDISTLIPTSGSHSFVTNITAGNKVEFIFENINLPFEDANNDGYIAFKIKTLPTLKSGDTFTNDASIYFDYNFPIVTNKASTLIQSTLNTKDFEFSNYFNLYPSPVSNILNIASKNNIEVISINIYNTLGQLVLVIPNAKNTKTVDVSNLTSGNYFVKINSNKGTSNTKFVKN